MIFCLISGTVYLINDLADIEKDRQHPKKRHRPLASGRLSTRAAQIAIPVILLSFLLMVPLAAFAEDGPSAEELARKAQDPLADVRAIMTDNTIAFGTADDQTSYGFQIQPVYSIPTDRGYTFIARAIIPILGYPPEQACPGWVRIRRRRKVRSGALVTAYSNCSGRRKLMRISNGVSVLRSHCPPETLIAWQGQDGAVE